ncbi:MAG TPA: ABC transporter permease [Thermoanaerobaculia bacterium]|nr:ABC transporter permease [Thermoanaerobaculia bacterium]
METFLREIRHGFRALAKAPGFAAVGILTLALGIGSSTAIFSVVDAVLLRALPYPKPQQLVRVWEQSPNGRRMNFADPNFDDFHEQNGTLSGLAAYSSRPASVAGGREPVRVDVAAVSADFFKVLGVEPARGRAFAADERRLHGTRAAIVSHAFWQRHLGSSADLSGTPLLLDGETYAIVGVMPPGFDFPAGAAAWIPRELDEKLPSRTAHNWQAVARLRDGVGLDRARANLAAIGRGIKDQYGKDADLVGAAVVPLGDALVGDVRTALLTLLGAVALLLLVACANVAGLMLARASARRRELAVRLALGAGRGRLLQQFLAEALALALAGGSLGVLLAVSAVRALPAILPSNLPRQDGVSVNLPVLLFALAATVAVAVCLGLVTAWRAASADPQEALAAGARGSGGTRASQRLRGALVAGEIAITLVILVGAGLLGRSFVRLVSTSPGFRTDSLVTIEFSAPIPREDAFTPPLPTSGPARDPGQARQIQLLDRVVERLRAIPGVTAVGLAGALPVAHGDDLADGTFLLLNDAKDSPADFDAWGRLAHDAERTGHADYAVASAGYFKTLGIPLVRGRLFGEQDIGSAPHVAVISESLARGRWPGRDPIGQVINFGNMDGNLAPLTIVGVVGDVRGRGLDQPPSPIVYVDYRQRGINGGATPTLLVRSAVPTSGIAAAARGVFRELAPSSPVELSTFDAELGGWLADRRFLLLLVGAFAAAALGLAAVGIYGVVAFSVARRTSEIGIRMALGARRADVLRLVVGEGARLAAVGLALGVAAAFAVTRLVESLLFGVSPTDAVTFAGVAALLGAVALLASYLPARRAMRLDPNVALRYE